MSKYFKYYAVCWCIAFVIFSVIYFVVPMKAEIGGIIKVEQNIMGSYIMIAITFIGQLICAYIAFRAKTLKKMFFNLSYITLSYAALILTIGINIKCRMTIGLPSYVPIIISLVILAFLVVNVIQVKVVSDMILETDEKVKTKTAFIKTTTLNVKGLIDNANDTVVKNELEKVYEAIKYSDPMSSVDLYDEETKISTKISELSDILNDESGENVEEIKKIEKVEKIDNIKGLVKEILSLINARNNKCKLLKAN